MQQKGKQGVVASKRSVKIKGGNDWFGCWRLCHIFIRLKITSGTCLMISMIKRQKPGR